MVSNIGDGGTLSEMSIKTGSLKQSDFHEMVKKKERLNNLYSFQGNEKKKKNRPREGISNANPIPPSCFPNQEQPGQSYESKKKRQTKL